MWIKCHMWCSELRCAVYSETHCSWPALRFSPDEPFPPGGVNIVADQWTTFITAQSSPRFCRLSSLSSYFNYLSYPCWSFHRSCYIPLCCFMLSIRICLCAAVLSCLVLHLEFHSFCLFLRETFSQASRESSLCITCTGYWSLVSVLIIFYHRGFSVTQWK